ncbi:synaptic vesicle membrane protein VAT-1 homolog isoform X2 [Schistocerca gregaria]|uniref:synaptic vesicle membrane protein VAT-1 homolog isoform X2 n=1 Tax=Schistocerca gregaria TaxID=7010 RepID=UPI00211E499B|nr:synaptic vesicle membrane protein VAT-1 homolog isoform X2 [Schistocerca gregaria]XP_049827093.1 synaptic vesicle membrane protein VAT-1 homolog isoform X2 [Schistocerca gregaria]
MEYFPLQYNAPTVVKRSPLAVHLGEEEVEVEVYYCGVNFTDNYLRLGIIRNSDFPVIMGSECSGIIMRVGAGVTDIKIGQGVLVLKMHGGLFRRAVNVPRKNCFVLPDNISLRSAVALGLNSLMAHLCLFELGGLREGQTVFMQSIAGGVGTSVIQLARTVPNVTVLGTASESKHKRALALGVNRIFHHKEKYFDKISKEYPDGADIIINSNGGRDMEKCLKFLKPCGRLINIGTNSTVVYPKAVTWRGKMPTWDCRSICTTPLIQKSQKVVGVNIGYFLERYPQKVQSILNRIFELRALWKIRPCIHSKIEIEQVTTAIELLCNRENYGKVILVAQDEPFLLNEPGHRISSPTETVPGSSPHAKQEHNSAMSAEKEGAVATKQTETTESLRKDVDENIAEHTVNEHS